LWPSPENGKLLYSFENFTLDTDRRELRRGPVLVTMTPQVFDLLEYLIRNRERVVSKDDLSAAIWDGRIVSESALTTSINAAGPQSQIRERSSGLFVRSLARACALSALSANRKCPQV